jgi:hypothetical protein
MFIYKTTHKDGKYYIGRCSRKHPETYLGSGRWVRSIKDKTTLKREILSAHESFKELCLAEETAIALHIDDPMCMNWNNKSVGFGTGEHNPSYKGMEGRAQSALSKQKISESRKQQIKNGEWIHPLLGKETSEFQKQRSSSVNSCEYKITYKDGTTEIIANLLQWCNQNGHSDIVFHRMHKNNKHYKGMIYQKIDPK